MYSPNMIKTFQTCPQKYYLKYTAQISVPQKTSYFERGKKIHALANYYLKGNDVTKLEKTLSQDELRIWENLKNNEYYKKTYVASEYDLACKIGDYWIGGRLDAIVKDENKFYVLDYKTGSIPKNPEYDFQTMVYLLCLYKNLKINEITTSFTLFTPRNDNENCLCERGISFVYIDLKNNTNCVVEFTLQKEYEQKIIQICSEIEKYQPPEEIEHSKICDFCEYRKICK